MKISPNLFSSGKIQKRHSIEQSLKMKTGPSVKRPSLNLQENRDSDADLSKTGNPIHKIGFQYGTNIS
ncbi:hypothetical protein [Burkholderia contaminans]|uniref:hypothetical protein n=1 Tax=Burkholderia contaminans TaxID=488447 RepID=UPI001583ECC2|nr:hypothetical protein [Burkholderia contaminans]